MMETTLVKAAIEGLVTGEMPSVALDFRVLPVVVRRGPKAVAITQQFPFPPLAYFESETGKIYVHPEHRERVLNVLNARVNSAGIWTFHGDLPAMGQAAQEDAYDKWDRTRHPKIGDFRIIDRSYATVRWEFNRLPIYDTDSPMWGNGKSITHGQRVGREISPGREDYRVVGTCDAYADPDCTQFAGKLDVLNWAALG